MILRRSEVVPSVDDVALLLRTRTVGPSSTGLGSDTGPEDITTFTNDTRPTQAEVDALIEVAADEVLGQLPEALDPRLYPAVKRAVAGRTAVLVELSFYRDTASSELLGQYLADVGALRAAMPGDSGALVARGVSARETALLRA